MFALGGFVGLPRLPLFWSLVVGFAHVALGPGCLASSRLASPYHVPVGHTLTAIWTIVQMAVSIICCWLPPPPGLSYRETRATGPSPDLAFSTSILGRSGIPIQPLVWTVVGVSDGSISAGSLAVTHLEARSASVEARRTPRPCSSMAGQV